MSPTQECHLLDGKLTSVIDMGTMMDANEIFTSVYGKAFNKCKRFCCCARRIVAGSHGRVLVTRAEARLARIRNMTMDGRCQNMQATTSTLLLVRVRTRLVACSRTHGSLEVRMIDHEKRKIV